MTLTIQLPKTEVVFLEDYTQRHHITIAELIDYFVEQLQLAEQYVLHPDIEKLAGIIPDHIDAKKEYSDYLEEKYR